MFLSTLFLLLLFQLDNNTIDKLLNYKRKNKGLVVFFRCVSFKNIKITMDFFVLLKSSICFSNKKNYVIIKKDKMQNLGNKLWKNCNMRVEAWQNFFVAAKSNLPQKMIQTEQKILYCQRLVLILETFRDTHTYTITLIQVWFLLAFGKNKRYT